MNNLRFLLPHLYAYVAVAKHKSFTRAADELCVSQSAISYQIKKLEELLGLKLLDRSCRNSVKLTNQGLKLKLRCQALFLELQEGLHDLNEEPGSHTLRIAAPSCLGTAILPSVISDIKQNQQTLNIHLLVDDGCIDLIQNSVDFAIRINNHDVKLEYIPIFNVSMKLVVAPKYIAKKGRPNSVKELSHHHIIMNHAQDSDWIQLISQLPDLQLETHFISYINNAAAVLAGAHSGLGIAYLPEYLVSESLASGKLVNVLANVNSPVTYYISHKKGLQVEPYLSMFAKYLLRSIQQDYSPYFFDVQPLKLAEL